jgi:hypothetical protein
MAHTPGPWSIHNYGATLAIQKDDLRIGFITSRGHGHPSLVDNAHLIAAAPEMLAALKGVVAALDHQQQTQFLPTDTGVRVKAARAAIAKAEGG